MVQRIAVRRVPASVTTRACDAGCHYGCHGISAAEGYTRITLFAAGIRGLAICDACLAWHSGDPAEVAAEHAVSGRKLCH